ncbi:MAG: fibronectin type III domain-containing protein, partial [Planctomycetota bacterium]|nr:fibronectin type III domain-containing protein [Planctomycetota bacterium]
MFFRSFARRQDRTRVTSADRLRRAVAETLEPRRLFTAITIDNPSFENPTLADGQTSATAAGWSITASAAGGVINPTSQDLPGGAPNGQNTFLERTDGWGDASANATQVLDATYRANTVYTLSVAAAVSGNTYDYGAALFAGDQALASSSTIGGDGRITLTFTSPGTSPRFGQPLKITLDSIMVFEDGPQSVFFDDVTLDATLTAPAVPTAPINLKAQGASPNHVRLTWAHSAGDETGFEVQRKQPDNSWLTVHTTGADATTWTESALSPGTMYTYRIRAVATNAAGTSQSLWASESIAPTFAAPPEIDNFEPADITNWVPFASDGSSSMVSLHDLPYAGAGAMRVDYTIGDATNTEWGGAGLTYGWAVSQDWTGYGSIDFAVEGTGSGRTLYLEVFDNMNPTTHTWEKFVYSFVDDLAGWQTKSVPFSSFVRKGVQDAGAPNDGFGRNEVWGLALLSWSNAEEYGEGSFGLDEIFLTDDAPTTPTVSIEATDPTATEAGLDPGEFTVTRTGDFSSALIVPYTLGGMATNGIDYQTLSESVTIPAGTASAPISVTPIQDTANEGNETVIATLTAPSGYALGTPSEATATIADDDGGTANFTLTAEATAPDKIALAWPALAGVTEYRVEASYDGADFGEFPVAVYSAGYNGQADPPTTTTFERLHAGMQLYVRVSAYNGTALLATSNVANA